MSDLISSGIEQEVIYLCSVNNMLDDLVNRAMMRVEKELVCGHVFRDTTHQRLFYILLTDLLSPTDQKMPVRSVHFVEALQAVVQNPHFDVDGSIDHLAGAVNDLVKWLEDAPGIPMWIPSLRLNVHLQTTRFEFLRMCGDLAKHDMLRAGRVTKRLVGYLQQAGHTVTFEQAALALQDVYSVAHEDMLTIYGPVLASMLNAVRWGVQMYLRPEFTRSYSTEGLEHPRYRYSPPAGLQSPLALIKYEELMNQVRSGPIIPYFRVCPELLGRY